MQIKTKRPKTKISSANKASIDKMLNVKPKIKFKTIIPEQYWDYLNVFDEDETNQLPPFRGQGINHQIELMEEEKRRRKSQHPLGPVIQYIQQRISGIKKTLTEYLGKNSFESTIHQFQPQYYS